MVLYRKCGIQQSYTAPEEPDIYSSKTVIKWIHACLKILELIKNSEYDKILLVGKVFSSLNGSFEIAAFVDVVEAKDWLRKLNPEGYNILIKGSRGIKLENLLDSL